MSIHESIVSSYIYLLFFSIPIINEVKHTSKCQKVISNITVYYRVIRSSLFRFSFFQISFFSWPGPHDETSEETEDDIDTTDWDALLKDDSTREPTETETTEEAEVEDENSKEEVKHESLTNRLVKLLIDKKSKNIYLTHNDLAFELYSSREVISRKLKELEKKGYLKLSRGKIQIQKDLNEMLK